jgi:site-specific DNA recombinase
MAGARRELAGVEREIQKIIRAILDGVPALRIKDAIIALEARRATLTAALAEPPLPALHPQMAEAYREKATALAAGLEHDEQRDAARMALRGFLEKIIIPPGEGLLQVVGNVRVMLAAAQGRTVQPGMLELGSIGGCGGI